MNSRSQKDYQSKELGSLAVLAAALALPFGLLFKIEALTFIGLAAVAVAAYCFWSIKQAELKEQAAQEQRRIEEEWIQAEAERERRRMEEVRIRAAQEQRRVEPEQRTELVLRQIEAEQRRAEQQAELERQRLEATELWAEQLRQQIEWEQYCAERLGEADEAMQKRERMNCILTDPDLFPERVWAHNEGAFSTGDLPLVVVSCRDFLDSAKYPDDFPESYELMYDPITQVLVVDFELPSPDIVPTLKEVRFIKSRNDFVEKHLTKRELAEAYDNLLYSIALRTISELFRCDLDDEISAIVFNGYVHSLDPATGRYVTPCVLSVETAKEQFLAIDLQRVEARACFKGLKGVGSPRLHTLTPIVPILRISREDSRFVSSRAIAADLQEGDNLAAMDWEDFEHLVREIFEREFTATGGEVKVTRASRDGGIDAVAFDPDPIRGGKIVIQAKRYTNTVGVAAVRDLYGAVINEGAMKGILVTTASYGPDAYEFAKDKPITLLNGGHLLHLLRKHGYTGRIDLQEAKRLAAESG